MSIFKKATREQAKLRLALIGPAGAGKTYSALAVACEIAQLMGKRVAVIDTECGSAELYAATFDFDTLPLSTHSPLAYVEAIHAAESEGYGVIVVDSLSHAWIGKDGALEQVDKAADRDPRSNSFTAWRSVTPKHTKLVDAMVSCKAHLVVTIRAKTEFIQEKNAQGKTEIRKVGLAPIQRDGLEYEFTLVGDIDLSNTLKISKTRLDGVIMPGELYEKPGVSFARKIYGWLMNGAAPATTSVIVPEAATTPARPNLQATITAAMDAGATRAEIEHALTPAIVDVPAATVATVEPSQVTLASTPPAQPDIVASSPVVETRPAETASIGGAIDLVFAKYAEAMADAKTVVELDRVATGPGRPTRGTDQHKLAESIYRRCKSIIVKQQEAASTPATA